jgi:hypothetical protein
MIQRPLTRASDDRLRENIILLDPQELFGTLDFDLDSATALDAWVYSVDAPFFTTMFGPVLGKIPIRVIADYRHSAPWRDLMNNYKNLRVSTWASNRTMHDKTIVIHGPRLVYLMTQNLHRGSFMLSLNRCARVQTTPFYQSLMVRFEDDFSKCRTLPPRQTPP